MIFHLPESLKDGLISNNHEIFSHAFHSLPKVSYLDKHHKIKDQHDLIKKEKTHLLGIPKQLAHDNPLDMFRSKHKALDKRYNIEDGAKSAAAHHSRLGSEHDDNQSAIMNNYDVNETQNILNPVSF